MEIADDLKGILLFSAREAIKSLFHDVPQARIDINQYPLLAEPNHGVFVTLSEHSELRGCIGFLYSERPLLDTVIDAAKHAAIYDPRFPKLRREELPFLEIEISVLSEPFPIEYDDIVIGKHGLILEEQGKRGLLLPQVATEHNMDLPSFLTAVCEKTNVEADLWRKKKLSLEAFTAVVFSERGKRKITHEFI